MSVGRGGAAGKQTCLLEMRERMRFSKRSSTSSLVVEEEEGVYQLVRLRVCSDLSTFHMRGFVKVVSSSIYRDPHNVHIAPFFPKTQTKDRRRNTHSELSPSTTKRRSEQCCRSIRE